ncbi:unnamed protein product [Psylliodes chrysocephalus]|uniref:Uncharacterized protein n=1 Tax=Psylliodes chrysocephalus TaxID=3402493 RepID=A0A9P0D8K2_9CUCU|nr:unnamed protein product [Psylliodes chrysocephala]
MHYSNLQEHRFNHNPSFNYSYISQPFFGDHRPDGYFEKVRSSKDNKSKTSKGLEGDEKCQGKYLKHIFNALKNKTSSELAAFINFNSVVNEVEYELSSVSFLNEPSKSIVPFYDYETYTVNNTNKKVGCGAFSKDVITSNRSHSHSQTTVSEVTITSFRAEIVKSEKKVGPDANINDEKIHSVKTSNNDKFHPYREVYEEKPAVNFLSRVLSMFKSKKDSKTCGCDTFNKEPEEPKTFAKDPDSLEPLFQNSNCKCSDTVIKVDNKIVQNDNKPNKSNKLRCNTLNRYKCERCGKIDLDKLDNRCPKLKLEEDALMFLLKLEARQNFKQIRNIQKQLKEQFEKLEDLNRKYISLMKIIFPDKLTKVGTDVSTDTVATRDKEVDAKTKKTDSCVCATKKKPSLYSRLFKKSKCDASCKCCLTPRPDKDKCKFFLEKKTSKKKTKEKDSKTSKDSKKKEKKEKKGKKEKK